MNLNLTLIVLMLFNERCWVSVCFLCFLALIYYVNQTCLHPKLCHVCDCFQYGVGLDAGSSHTKLYVYRWPVDKKNGTGIVDEIHSCPSRESNIS